MNTVRLKPSRVRLRQLIREFGPVWEEVARRPVACFGDTASPQMGVLIRSLDGKHERWARPEDLGPNPGK